MSPTTTPEAMTTAPGRTILTQGFTVAYVPDRAAVADARRTTADQVRRWTWDPQGEFAQDVVLAVSELVTNGIEHGYGDVTLTVWRTGGQLRVEVADENPAPAILRRADGNAVSGRGLRIVSTVATKWGVSQDGTTTWCVFNLPQGNAR